MGKRGKAAEEEDLGDVRGGKRPRRRTGTGYKCEEAKCSEEQVPGTGAEPF